MIMIQLKKWRKQTPSEPFKDYFAASVEAKLRGGKPHASLGGNLLDGEYGVSGASHFKRLVDFGLNPGDTCVDYGCGTLRVGIHAITYLGKRKLIGETLYERSSPLRNLQASLQAAALPALLSRKGLDHSSDDLLSTSAT
jgi:hypothetical protein